MESLKVNKSFVSKQLRSSTIFSSYQPINPNTKPGEYTFKAEIQQFLRDIEDSTKSDAEAWERYSYQFFLDDFKQKLREIKYGQNEYSLLHIAAKHCRKSFCLFLIQEVKLDKDIKCKSKSTPFHLLIKSNIFSKHDFQNNQLLDKWIDFRETFNLFIEKGADINFQDEIGYSPLHYAAAKNNYGAILSILRLPGVNIISEDKKYITPLHLACKYGFDEAAELLIEKIDPEKLINPSSNLDFSNVIPLHLACRNKNEKAFIVKKILDKLKENSKKINYLEAALKKEDNSRQTIYLIAIENNHLNIVEYLLRDFKVNKEQKDGQNGNMAIHFCAKTGSVEMFHLLQKYDAVSFKTNNNQENALHIAAYNNKHKFIKEFLQYEKCLLEKQDSENYMPCICKCDDYHTLSIRQRDHNNYTPLLTALAASNQRCVEELLNDPNIELDAKDISGNSVFHICSEFDNGESLKFLFQHYSTDIIYSKNNLEESVLHSCCRNGNLEMVKTILNKAYDSNIPIEQFIFMKNKDGQTCFHIACIKGYCNIIEYFLKDKKMNEFLDHYDNNSNTALHLATMNGHSSIVTVLLDHGADVKAKNEESNTALDLSCKRGYFEISKNIINNYSSFTQNQTHANEFPLHLAAYEGAAEVVKLLLLKGVPIDQLNNENRNCLDIAISRGQREVIRVLLNDDNWAKLIRFNDRDKVEDADEYLLNVVTQNPTQDNDSTQLGFESAKKEDKIKKIVENPQLVALYDAKMWDIFKLLLDKCVTYKEVDFTKIDPPVKSISAHTLMLIARSGQENLLKHEATRILLDLKWRLIPRFAFYFNLIIYMLFMVFFSLYSIQLAHIGQEMNKVYLSNYNEYLSKSSLANRTNLTANMTKELLKAQLFKDPSFYRKISLELANVPIFYFLVILLTFQLVKELTQMFFLDGLSYFLSLQNLIELFTYVTALLSLFSKSYYYQSAYGSIAVLFAYIVFPLFIQKLKMFGVYVVAFLRTLKNSAKFFPIFFFMFTGFILSFRIRSNFEVSYFNSTSYSIIRTLTMVVGELSTDRMGLHNDSLPNYIIYFLFIGLMCTILINLFVGIAVGEIKTVLDEADIQQTSMRIMFVLKVQSALYPFRKTFLKKFLRMNFEKYSLEDSNKFLQLKNKLWNNAKNLLKEQEIKLSDPQKRLEDSFNEMARSTQDQIKSIRFGFSNQITDSESRLSNTQRRIQDSIIELNNKLNEKLIEFREESKSSDLDMRSKIKDTQKQIENAIIKFSEKTNDEFVHTNKHFDTQMTDSELKILNLNNKIQNILLSISNSNNFQYESIKEYSINQTKNLKSIILSSQKIIEDSFSELEVNHKRELIELNQNIENRIVAIDTRLVDSEIQFRSLIGQLSNDTLIQLNRMRENYDSELEKLKVLLSSTSKSLSESVGEVSSKINFEFNSNKVSNNYLANQLNSFELQLSKTVDIIEKMSQGINQLNAKIENL